MSYTIDLGYTRPTTTKNLAVPDWDGSTAWSEMPYTKAKNEPKDQIGKQYSAASSSPLRPCILKKFWRPIENIYAAVQDYIKVNPYNRNPVTNGIVIGAQLYSCLKITDSITNSEIYSPISGMLSLQFGLHEAITADVLKAYLCDVVDQMFPHGSVTSNQIAAQANRSFEFLDEAV